MAKAIDGLTLKVNLDTEELMEKLINYDLANPTVLQLQRVSETVNLPYYATKQASRFDLHAALDHVREVVCYDRSNNKIMQPVNEKDGVWFLDVPAQSRILIPTGFIFGIPEDYELTLVPRSSTALKLGLTTANAVGVIDRDFSHETQIMLYNMTSAEQRITHNDRLAQGKLNPTFQAIFDEVDVIQEVVSDRVGGFGSTNK